MDEKKNFFRYLAYSKEDKALGMVCTTAGTTEILPGTPYPPRKAEHPLSFQSVADGRILKDYVIVYITRGSGILITNTKTWRLKTGSIFIIKPGTRHLYEPDIVTGWVERWVCFSGDFFDDLLSRFSRHNILPGESEVFDIGLHDDILAVFSSIFEEVAAEKPLYQIRACAGIVTLLSEIAAWNRRKNQPGYYQQIVEAAKYIMEENINSKIDVPEIAAKIGLSAPQFHVIFKRYTSQTPYQYFIRAKISRAQAMLENPRATIRAVAYELGFEDQYNFSRLFKKVAGISPSKWRGESQAD
jgi:AraC-like DNA-binding protein